MMAGIFTTLGQARVGYLHGQEQGEQQHEAGMRQRAMDELARRLKEAQIGETTARTAALGAKAIAPPKPPHTDLAQLVHARIRELTGAGMELPQANAQARSEYGYAPPRPPSLHNQHSPSGITPEERQRSRSYTAVSGQTREALTDLHAAEHAQPKRPGVFLSDEAERRFPADSAHAAQRVSAARQRADSLRGVRDSLAAEIQGRSAPAPAASPVVQPFDADAAYTEAASAYRQALADGEEPRAAKEKYQHVVELIAARHQRAASARPH